MGISGMSELTIVVVIVLVLLAIGKLLHIWEGIQKFELPPETGKHSKEKRERD